MSILFEPMKIGKLQVENRFIRSATYENMADESGGVTKEIIRLYRLLAKGGIGLIISGYLYIHPLGRSHERQLGIHRDDLVPGLKELVDAVHQEGGKIAFELNHAGRQTSKDLIGRNPISPSSTGRNPFDSVKPTRMKDEQIQQAIRAFEEAAFRAAETGVDAIQIDAAHGQLISQFLSPYLNARRDEWGGSDENRFRFLKAILLATRGAIPDRIALLVKLNTQDHTPQEGVTPELAMKYTAWLAELGVDATELSCGTMAFSFMNICRGEVPVNEFLYGIPEEVKPFVKPVFDSMLSKYDLVEGYNLEAAKRIKPTAGNMPIILVGGLRRVAHMEQILEDGHADFISMCRPFIREPSLVKKIKAGKTDIASCASCNKCFAALGKGMPLRCYSKGLPA